MRVAVYHANDDLRLAERPVPAIGPGELLLRVEASGICGSDLLEWYRRPRAPVVLGHEVAGTVERVGAGVGFTPGERVVATHHVPCGSCRYCRTDRESACELLHRTSFDPGGFAELLRLSPVHVERGTFRLPDGVDFDEGSFVEPLACTLLGQRRAGVCAGDRVLVIGTGVAGLLHVALARLGGAERVVGVDVHEERLAAARAAGAHATHRAGSDLPERLAASGDAAFERVIVCTAAPAAMAQAPRLADRGGAVLFFAPLAPGEHVPLDLAELWRRGVTIVHSYAGPPAAMREALDLIATRRIDVRGLITHRLPLGSIGEGFRLAAEARSALKIIVQPQERRA